MELGGAAHNAETAQVLDEKQAESQSSSLMMPINDVAIDYADTLPFLAYDRSRRDLSYVAGHFFTRRFDLRPLKHRATTCFSKHRSNVIWSEWAYAPLRFI